MLDDDSVIESDLQALKNKLTKDQLNALNEILSTEHSSHCLRGYAGSGKTFLMQAVAKAFEDQGKSVVLTAPTHKAVQVIASKLSSGGFDFPTMTIHSLLGLKVSGSDEKTKLKRGGVASFIKYDVIVIDEASMIGSDLQQYISSDLSSKFVLYVGDPAQLPPVGEELAECFGVKSQSELTQIVRQEADNPILEAATIIRKMDPAIISWDWMKLAESGSKGVFPVGSSAEEWMNDAFTSESFKENNDMFRYLCYTNARVAEVNRQVRRWIYGQTGTPFVEGERAICRSPIQIEGVGVVFNTNEEITVESIESGVENLEFKKHPSSGKNAELQGFSYQMPVWKIGVKHEFKIVKCSIVKNETEMKMLDNRIVSEAKMNSSRWYERFLIGDKIAKLQHVYAMTCHTSQGSTFGNVFVDIADIRKNEFRNPQEMLKMLYVAATRPTHALVLVNT